MSMIPTIEDPKYLPIAEFCKRYNNGRPESMKLEPSFVKFLCEQKSIEYSELPSHDGRKNDVYMIPEYELEKVDILLNANTEKTLTAEEVSLIIGCNKSYISVLARKGDLKRTRSIRNGKMTYLYQEESVKKYIEKRNNKKEKSATKPDDAENLKRTINELRKKNDKLVSENADLKDRLKHSISGDKDVFEAYRHGFKDGFAFAMEGKK